MAYEVVVVPAANRSIARLPRALRARIAQRLLALADDPRPPGYVKLTNQNVYRIRVGDYRVLYTVQDERLIVTVVNVGHRSDIYRKKK